MGHHNTKYLTLPIAVFVYLLSIMGTSMKHASQLFYSPWIQYAVPIVLTAVLVAYFIINKKWFYRVMLIPVSILMTVLLYFGYLLLFSKMSGGVSPIILFLLPFIGYLIFYYYEYIYYDYDNINKA